MAQANQKGFTLVELLITLVISALICAALYSSYAFQQRSQVSQQQVVDMQSSMRTALLIMTRQIRMAGFDPQETSPAGVVTATVGRFQFTQDNNDNGANNIPGNGDVTDPGENITFGFADADDSNHDGIADAGIAPLGMDTGSGFQPIAEDISRIEFAYTLTSGARVTDPTPGQYADIRMVTISLLARAQSPDRGYLNHTTYTMASGATWTANDHYRRRLLIADIKLKNMGL